MRAGVSGLTTNLRSGNLSIPASFGIDQHHEFTHAFSNVRDEYLDTGNSANGTDETQNVVASNGGRACRVGRWRPQRWVAMPPTTRYTQRVISGVAKGILEAAMKLAPQEREELIEELSASLDVTDLGEYWETEIKRRIEDVDSGRAIPVPADEV